MANPVVAERARRNAAEGSYFVIPSGWGTLANVLVQGVEALNGEQWNQNAMRRVLNRAINITHGK